MLLLGVVRRGLFQMIGGKRHAQVPLHRVVFAVLGAHRISDILHLIVSRFHHPVALSRGSSVEHVLLEPLLARGLALVSAGKVKLAGHV